MNQMTSRSATRWKLFRRRCYLPRLTVLFAHFKVIKPDPQRVGTFSIMATSCNKSVTWGFEMFMYFSSSTLPRVRQKAVLSEIAGVLSLTQRLVACIILCVCSGILVKLAIFVINHLIMTVVPPRAPFFKMFILLATYLKRVHKFA